jgi:dTDP-4-dehydrorhamnose reductase
MSSAGDRDVTSVCAVVVTYNRKLMLERCLAALAAQTMPVKHIVIIDNGSSDGTATMLSRRRETNLLVTSLPSNTGAAGGFSTGVKRAYETGADGIWVMDDDVFPDPDALEELLRAQASLVERGAAFAFLVSVARSNGGQLTEVPDIDRRPNGIGFPGWPELIEDALIPVRGATFASILLPRETLRHHGLPIASMFIFGEDREFTVRVTQDRPGFLVGRSKVVHARKIEGVLDIWTETDRTRLGYQWYLHRNTTSTMMRYERKRKFAYHLLQQADTALRLAMRGRLRRCWVVVSATFAGLRFRPAIEAAESLASASRSHPLQQPQKG